MASDLLSWIVAPLLELYATAGYPVRPETDEALTTDGPRPEARRCRAANFTASQIALVLMSKTASQASSGSVSNVASAGANTESSTPAWLTSVSSPPMAATADSTIASTWALLRRSTSM